MGVAVHLGYVEGEVNITPGGRRKFLADFQQAFGPGAVVLSVGDDLGDEEKVRAYLELATRTQDGTESAWEAILEALRKHVRVVVRFSF